MKKIILTTLGITLLAVGCSTDPVETTKAAKELAINETVITTGTFEGKSVTMESTKLTNTLSVTIIRPNKTTSRSRVGNEGSSILIKPTAFIGRNFNYAELTLIGKTLKCNIVDDGILISNESIDDLLNIDIASFYLGKGLDKVLFTLDPVDARALRSKLIRYEFENTGIDIDSLVENDWISDEGDTFSFDNNTIGGSTHLLFSKGKGGTVTHQIYDEDTKTFNATETYDMEPLRPNNRYGYYIFDEGNLANSTPEDPDNCDLKIVSCTQTDLVLTIKTTIYNYTLKDQLSSGHRIEQGIVNGTMIYKTSILPDMPIAVNYTIHYKKVE